MPGKAAYLTEVKLGGTPTTMSSEATTQSSDGSVYQITDATRRVLNRKSSAVPTVYQNAVAANSSNYQLNYLFGKVNFDSTKASSIAVTISGEYIPVGSSEKITHCNSHDVAIESDVLEDTGYKEAQESSGNRSRLLGLMDSNVGLDRFEDGGREFFNALSSKDDLLIEVKPAGADPTFRGWYKVEETNFSGGVEDLEAKDVTLQANAETIEGDTVSFGFSS